MKNFDRQLILNELKTRFGSFENSAESKALIKCFEFCESIEIAPPPIRRFGLKNPAWEIVATKIAGVKLDGEKVVFRLNSGEVLTLDAGGEKEKMLACLQMSSPRLTSDKY